MHSEFRRWCVEQNVVTMFDRPPRLGAVKKSGGCAKISPWGGLEVWMPQAAQDRWPYSTYSPATGFDVTIPSSRPCSLAAEIATWD